MSNIIILSEIKETISNSFELLRYNGSWIREPELFWRLRLRNTGSQTSELICSVIYTIIFIELIEVNFQLLQIHQFQICLRLSIEISKLLRVTY